nr:hypothetical protein [uncultured Vibrio sp.]
MGQVLKECSVRAENDTELDFIDREILEVELDTNDVTIDRFLLDNGFKSSKDGLVLVSQSEVDSVVQLLQTSGIPDISEVNAYSMLVACKQVIISN